MASWRLSAGRSWRNSLTISLSQVTPSSVPSSVRLERMALWGPQITDYKQRTDQYMARPGTCEGAATAEVAEQGGGMGSRVGWGSLSWRVVNDDD